MNAQEGRAKGLQIAFLIFAVALLATPLERLLRRALDWHDWQMVSDRLFVFVPAIAALLLFPALRRRCKEELRVPVPRSHVAEVATVSMAHVLAAVAAGGAVVLWHWLSGGEPALARRLGEQMTHAAQWSRALSLEGVLFTFLVAGLVGPVVEELVFRGMLYRAWAREWGWFPSMMATSAVFAAYHTNHFSAFVGSVLYIVLLRRTGSLWACIAAHSAFNILVWYPFLGQFLFRTAGKETGELHLWTVHLALLGLVVLAVPAYVWMARDPAPGEDDPEELEPAAS